MKRREQHKKDAAVLALPELLQGGAELRGRQKKKASQLFHIPCDGSRGSRIPDQAAPDCRGGPSELYVTKDEEEPVPSCQERGKYSDASSLSYMLVSVHGVRGWSWLALEVSNAHGRKPFLETQGGRSGCPTVGAEELRQQKCGQGGKGRDVDR